MLKIYLVGTNAGMDLIAIDEKNEVARIADAEKFGIDTVEKMKKIEDCSSWDDDYNFDKIIEMLNNENCKILGTIEIE